MDDLEEEYQVRALLAKSKRFFKKDCFSKTSIPSYQSPFQNNSQPILLSSTQHKPEVRPTKDFEAKYNKVKAKLALLISSSSAPKSSMVKKKGLVAEVYKWDEEEVSSDDNEIHEVKALMAFTDDNNALTKKVPGMKRILGADQLAEDSSSSRQKYLVFVKTLADNTNVSEAEGFILPNHDTGRNLQAKSQAMSQGNTIDHLVVVTDSSATDYDSGDESAVYRIPFPPLEKLARITINEASSAPAKANIKASTLKINSAPPGKLKSVKTEDDLPLSICERTDHRTCDHAEYMSTMNTSQRSSTVHTTTDQNDIGWFGRGEALQAKTDEALKSKKAKS
ncbi:hypothetical protein Tco_1330304 [Tanacetum coccineum]